MTQKLYMLEAYYQDAYIPFIRKSLWFTQKFAVLLISIRILVVHITREYTNL